MSDRTRLDELIDEERHAWGASTLFGVTLMGFARRLAERVFRHGVEQALEAEWIASYPHPLGVTPSKIRPAPAKDLPGSTTEARPTDTPQTRD